MRRGPLTKREVKAVTGSILDDVLSGARMAKKKAKPKKTTKRSKCRRAMQAQTVVFPAAKFSEKKARQWLRAHHMTIAKIDRTPTELRFRQFSPDSCKKGQFASIPMGKTGIRKILCCRK